MKNLTEIRWHGRGGQGAKTAALLLADVAFKTGKYVQGFPEYGPERMGAPINPQYVVVVDESLLETVDVTKGLKEEGAILINTTRSKEELIPHLKGYKGKVFTLDAHKVSMETMGKYFPNTPLLAAIVKVAGIMDETIFLSEMESSFKHKFASKPEVIEGNMAALKMAMQEVQS